MIRNSIATLTIFGMASFVTPSVAQDVDNGRKLARKCSACHGKQGVSRDPEVPILAGQHAFYLEKVLKDYRDGRREDRRMTLIVKPLEDEDISDLAAWFASFKITVEAPE
ncbi:MAG: cytochrome c [Pseudoruegeria sp.]